MLDKNTKILRKITSPEKQNEINDNKDDRTATSGNAILDSDNKDGEVKQQKQDSENRTSEDNSQQFVLCKMKGIVKKKNQSSSDSDLSDQLQQEDVDEKEQEEGRSLKRRRARPSAPSS